MPFLVQAFDGTDSEAPARRLAARPRHIEVAKALKADGRLVIAGAMLNEAGGMTGSTLILDVPTDADAEALIRADPYVAGNVWQRWTITPFRVAQL